MSPTRRLGIPLAAALLFAGDAGAVRSPTLFDERPLEPAVGRGRRDVPTGWQTPASARRVWQQWTAARGGAWQAIWDLDREVPLRVFGQGVAFPGASGDARTAEAAARAMLAEQLDLLAPGSRLDDWSVVSNVVHGRSRDMRTVGFVQRHAGMPVLGGAVSFLFKHDRVIVMSSAAVRDVRVSPPGRLASDDDVEAAALGWIERLHGARPRTLAMGEVVVLPVVREADGVHPVIEHRTVRTVVVDLDQPGAPRGRWNVYVDATTAAPVARAQLLRFGAGTVRFDAPVRYPAGGRMDYPASRAGINVGGAPQVTDAAGAFTFNGAGPTSVITAASGPLVSVLAFASTPATSTISVPDGGSGTWSAATVPNVDAQVAAFVHASLVKAYAKAELDPDMAWLDATLDVVVNENGTCNAYSDGDSIHFFVAGDGCENTGRLADVVYHEFGHSLHAHAVIPGVGDFDSHMSEGISDYLAATITGDPGMGRGFVVDNAQSLRHIDLPGDEAHYPEDMDNDPHESGLIIAGALWDLRKEYIAQFGADQGRRMADDALMATLRRATDIPTTYVEVLAGDDDDGNLANGTPNKCTIDRAFLPHGLVDLSLAAGLTPPQRHEMEVRVPVVPPGEVCPAVAVSGGFVDWRLAGATDSQRVALGASTGGFAALIPEQAEGAIVQYQVTVTLGSGNYQFPQNAADPWYQFYAGPLVPLYCTDFESDPFAAGWAHSSDVGNSDWQWGVPRRARQSGDPAAPFSGNNVLGQDLGGNGGNGLYTPERSNELTSPVFDVTGRTGVRLQYRRWLGVEDGFYDKATIVADGAVVWSNLAGEDEASDTHHLDMEWREHDVDISAQAADGSVQIAFRLEADGGVEFGGWNLEDLCIMARPFPGEICGDGGVALAETCDDGNRVDGDGCSATCTTELVPPDDDGGCCSTGGGPAGPLALGFLSTFALLRRRRRRRCKDTGKGAFPR